MNIVERFLNTLSSNYLVYNDVYVDVEDLMYNLNQVLEDDTVYIYNFPRKHWHNSINGISSWKHTKQGYAYWRDWHEFLYECKLYPKGMRYII